jgi:hypothetical protein
LDFLEEYRAECGADGYPIVANGDLENCAQPDAARKLVGACKGVPGARP